MKKAEDKSTYFNCARCPIPPRLALCRNDTGKGPEACPTRDSGKLVEESLQEYQKENILHFAQRASIQESEGYGNKEQGYDKIRPIKTRIEEIIEFSQKMNYHRLGMAFCGGLRKEAKLVEQIFSARGFEVVSVVCKVGRVQKKKIGLSVEQTVALKESETMCNPILQALVLNEQKTDFNILIGLCVGHDSLFFKYGKAPCTVLAVKDRVMGHNPLAPVYLEHYYRSLKNG